MVKVSPAKITVGKRKTAICRIMMKPGDGTIVINKRPASSYFGREVLHYILKQPFEATGTIGQYDVTANIKGGGLSGQASSLRHAITRSLLDQNPDFRKPLKAAGLITRDAREVESKKYGHHKARRGNQWTKR